MGPPTHSPKRLVVEGNDDKQSVLSLARSRLQWSQSVEDSPVFIDIGGSAEEILKPAYLTALLKTRELRIIGIMLDADDKPEGRYERIRNVCSEFFPALPKKMPDSGLIIDNAEQKRFGAWIMPDNSCKGDLEIFLRYLVPESSERVWEYAVECVKNAQAKGAPYHDSYISKANLYTWLAWQNPPGQSPGVALTKKILDPTSENATPFVNWFRELYELQEIQ